MICPICESPTEIRDSRSKAPGQTYRRHCCAMGHVFSTLETVEKFLEQKTCMATGKRKYWLMRAAQLAGDVYKCEHCENWHLKDGAEKNKLPEK
jgi:hypothetical protein